MSRIFEPFRAVGLVSGEGVPALQSLGTENFVTVPVGRAFHVYNTRHLELSLVSRPIQGEISILAVHKSTTFAACGEAIHVFRRMSEVAVVQKRGLGDVVAMLVMGPLLVAAYESGSLVVFSRQGIAQAAKLAASSGGDIEGAEGGQDGGEIQRIDLGLPSDALATCICHPQTYVNKVLVGATDGRFRIVNLRSGRVLYTSRPVAPALPGGAGAAAALTCAVASPALDVVGFGTSDGRVAIHNVKLDKAVMSFKHSASGAASAADQPGPAVSAVSFCSDPMQPPVVASATARGDLALWHLAEKRALWALEEEQAHTEAITGAFFLPKQPSLVTVGEDNCVKQWLLDALDSQPRLLRHRSGHKGTPTAIRYFFSGSTVATQVDGADAHACTILSGGEDRAVRLTHTALDRQNQELSQGKLVSKARRLGVRPHDLRLPPITALACCDRRHGDWDDTITAHRGLRQAYTWNFANRVLGSRVLLLAGGPDAEVVTAVDISPCGSFAVLGGSHGTIQLFSMQSGAPRGWFPPSKRQFRSFAQRGRRRKGQHAHQLPLAARGASAAPEPTQAEADAAAAGGGGVLAGGEVFAKGGRRAAMDRKRRAAKGLPEPAEAQDKVLKGLSASGYVGGGGAAPGGVAAGRAGSWAAAAESVAEAADEAAEAAELRAQEAAAAASQGKAVYGVVVDGRNKHLVSADAGGVVTWWDFSTRLPMFRLELGSPVAAVELHRESGLLAVACDDCGIRLFDIGARRLVRRFNGHRGGVTAMAFSQDGRWLVSASVDGHVRVWDVPTSRCVDWMRFHTPVRALAMSPTSEYLVTTHAGESGMFLWASKALYEPVRLDKQPRRPADMGMPFSSIDGSVAVVGDRSEEGGEGEDEEGLALDAAGKRRRLREEAAEAARREQSAAAAGDEEAKAEEAAAAAVTAEGAIVADPSRATPRLRLTDAPSSQWENLAVLDVIRQRNKPKQPPKKPEAAPFFIPTVAGVNLTLARPAPTPADAAAAEAESKAAEEAAEVDDGEAWASAWDDDQEGGGDGQGDNAAGAEEEQAAPAAAAAAAAEPVGSRAARSELASLLHTVAQSHLSAIKQAARRRADPPVTAGCSAAQLAAPIAHLRQLGPARLDADVHTLCLNEHDHTGRRIVLALLRCLLHAVSSREHVDAVQSYLAHCLRVHGEVITFATSASAARADGGQLFGEEDLEADPELEAAERRDAQRLLARLSAEQGLLTGRVQQLLMHVTLLSRHLAGLQ